MKRFLFICLTFALTIPLVYSISLAGNGNNLPSGPRYMLNVIAFDNCPAGDFTDSNRHMIAVKANYGTIDPENGTTSNQAGTLARDIVRTNTIALTQGADFQVIDGNACSKGGAEFMLPANPYTCPTDDPYCLNTDPTFQEYRVYVRLVGKPNTAIGVTTCAVDPLDPATEDDDIIVCSTENVIKVRSTGKDAMRFDDVSKELLTICLDTMIDGNLDGNCDIRYALFDPALYSYFWQWNTQGKAHAQLVFIPIAD